MPTYQIEMLWTCSICATERNRGLERHCRNCGKPKDDSDQEFFPEDTSEANALSGDGLRKALAGPDWKCKYCLTLQNSTGKCCTRCGADQATGKQPWKHLQKSTDGTTRERTIGESFDDTTEPETETPVVRKPPPLFGTPQRRFFGVAFFAMFLLFVGVWAIFRTHVVEARVASVSWQHKTLVERYHVEPYEGWQPDPGAFDVQNRGSRFHHNDRVPVGSHQEPYSDRYACGEDCHTVSGSCYTTPRHCSSNGNGTASCSGGDRHCSPDRQSCSTRYCTRTLYRTVTDYQNVPRYRDWYAWKEWEWGLNRTITRAGSTLQTEWAPEAALKPPAPLAAGEQERTRQVASYEVTFKETRGDDTFKIAPPTLSEFERFRIGTSFRLRANAAGSVEVLKPGETE